MREIRSDLNDQEERLLAGEVVVSGGHALAQCQKCGKIVRLTKWLVGSLHVCRGGDSWRD